MTVSTSIRRLSIGIHRIYIIRRVQHGRDGGALSPASYSTRHYPATRV